MSFFPSCSYVLWGSCLNTEKVGVLFVLHGGMDTVKPQYVWDSAMQQFSYNPNHPANSIIYSASMWGIVLQQEIAKKYLLKYEFEYPRIGGTDPFTEISMQQMKDMQNGAAAAGMVEWLYLCV